MDEFKIIPEAPNYEINREGVVRNRKTSRVLKPTSVGQVGLYIAVGERIRRYPKSLAAEIFNLPMPKRRTAPGPITLSKGDCKFSFKNILSAAEWLSAEVFFSCGYLQSLMHKRDSEIYGWDVTYGNC